MNSEWTADYDQNKIRITNSWITGEKLFVNEELQDERLSFLVSNLTGNARNLTGEKVLIKANISGFFTSNCRLFIDDKKIKLKQTKQI